VTYATDEIDKQFFTKQLTATCRNRRMASGPFLFGCAPRAGTVKAGRIRTAARLGLDRAEHGGTLVRTGTGLRGRLELNVDGDYDY
jgi:hypothetical protein